MGKLDLTEIYNCIGETNQYKTWLFNKQKAILKELAKLDMELFRIKAQRLINKHVIVSLKDYEIEGVLSCVGTTLLILDISESRKFKKVIFFFEIIDIKKNLRFNF